MVKKDWLALQAVLGSLTRQSCFHPTISYYRAQACYATGQTSDCLLICDVLLKGGLDDSSLNQKVQALADSIRANSSIHFDLNDYHSKLKAYFQQYGWHAVFVNGREQSVAILTKSVVKEAIAARDSGLVQMSLLILNLALLYDENNPWALENKARALCLLGDYREAMQICRDILRAHPKHRAKDSALSMLQKYDREYRLSSIYSDIESLVLLGSAKRQEALQKLRTSFDVGFTPEATRLMKLMAKEDQADYSEGEDKFDEIRSDLRANTEINRGLSNPAETLLSLRMQ